MKTANLSFRDNGLFNSYLEMRRHISYQVGTLYSRGADCVILNISLAGSDQWNIVNAVINDSNRVSLFIAKEHIVNSGSSQKLDTSISDIKSSVLIQNINLCVSDESPLTEDECGSIPDISSQFSCNLEKPISIGDIEIYRETKTLVINGNVKYLRNREFDLILYMIQNFNKVVSRNDLLSNVWPEDVSEDSRTIDIHISGVRRQLRDSKSITIDTVFGVGYIMKHRKNNA